MKLRMTAEMIQATPSSSASSPETSSKSSGSSGTFWLVVMVIAYFFPTALALTEKKRNTVAIFALNLLLGWTLIGWVIAIVWALTKDSDKERK